MADATTHTTASRVLMVCPACREPIQCRLAMDMTLGAIQPGKDRDHATIPVSATIQGLSVSHDCIPKATRDLGPQTPAPFRSTTTPERTAP